MVGEVNNNKKGGNPSNWTGFLKLPLTIAENVLPFFLSTALGVLPQKLI
jgi:hypothetical protein